MNSTTIAAELAIEGKKNAARKNVWPRIPWLTITASGEPERHLCRDDDGGQEQGVRDRLGDEDTVREQLLVVREADELASPANAPVEEADDERVADGEDLEHEEQHHRDGDERKTDDGLVTTLGPKAAPDITSHARW